MNEITSLFQSIPVFENCEEDGAKESMAGDEGETELKNEAIINIIKTTLQELLNPMRSLTARWRWNYHCRSISLYTNLSRCRGQ